MGFLKRLFGSQDKPKPDNPGDPQGVYFYVQCSHCHTIVRIRADRQHDFNREGDQFVWHKVIVDSKCFRRMPTVVYLDSQYNIVNAEIQGGEYVTQEAYDEQVRSLGEK